MEGSIAIASWFSTESWSVIGVQFVPPSVVFQMPPVSVVTTVSFDEGSDYPSLRFGDPQPNENLAVHFGRQEEARKLLETEPDVSQYGAQQAAKAPKRPAAKSARR